jgi:primosomal protein N'
MLLGRSYRSSEETLRLLARLANAVSPGSGHRMMVQTKKPESDLIQTLRRGNPVPYLERVLVERARGGVPPSTSMLAVELRGLVPDNVSASLEDIEEISVLGPLDIDDGKRWLLQGELRRARRDLRKLVGRWRDLGATVRIDSDPIDL